MIQSRHGMVADGGYPALSAAGGALPTTKHISVWHWHFANGRAYLYGMSAILPEKDKQS
ncbi:MAG: hypothetical protein ACLTV1_05790 [Christensenellales bacterium]